MPKLLYKGIIQGIQKQRNDHWDLKKIDNDNFKLERKDLISKWVIDNTNRLKHEFKEKKFDTQVDIKVHFITRRKRELTDLLKGFYLIMGNVFIEDTRNIVNISATYEISNKKDEKGLKRVITSFEIYEHINAKSK